MLVSDPEDRAFALRTVLDRDLFVEPQGLSWDVVLYLRDNERWLDLRPFEALFRKSRFADSLLAYVAQNELRLSSRAERMGAYRQALENGTVTLRNDWVLDRGLALYLAAWDGLEDLRSAVQGHFEEFAESKTKLVPLAKPDPLEYFLLTLDLRAGGEDREDAARVGAGRLAKLADGELRKKADSDPVFSRVLIETAKFVCETDPYTGWQNSGCEDVFDIFRRQMDLRSKAPPDLDNNTAGGSNAESGSRNDRPEWLLWLSSRPLSSQDPAMPGVLYSTSFEQRYQSRLRNQPEGDRTTARR